MNITLLRARQWSLALLLIGLLNSEHLLADYAVPLLNHRGCCGSGAI